MAELWQIGGVDPAGIDAVMDDGGVSPWLRQVMPPVRMLAGPCRVLDGHEQQTYELVRPSAGQDLQWLARGSCALEPDAVAQALSARLGGSVSARTVEAGDPQDDCYRMMTLVRVAANCAGLMAALVVAGPGVRVAGEVATILPCTQVRQQMHRIPRAPQHGGTTA